MQKNHSVPCPIHIIILQSIKFHLNNFKDFSISTHCAALQLLLSMVSMLMLMMVTMTVTVMVDVDGVAFAFGSVGW